MRLATLGSVERFDYPYARAGKKRPDPHARLVAAHRDALEAARRNDEPAHVILCGKSMGSRIGCHVSLEVPVSALVCFGYPLRGQSGALRDEVLRAMTTPILFVQGTRDPLCPLAELDRVRAAMSAPSELFLVDSGDHSLVPQKTWLRRNATTGDAVDAAILAAIERFLAKAAPVRNNKA